MRALKDFSPSVALIDAAITLLGQPGEIHRRADDDQRRQLNQAFFSMALVDETEVTDVVVPPGNKEEPLV
jgi:hypothetical protein